MLFFRKNHLKNAIIRNMGNYPHRYLNDAAETFFELRRVLMLSFAVVEINTSIEILSET